MDRNDFDFKDVPKTDYPIVERLVKTTPNQEGAAFGGDSDCNGFVARIKNVPGGDRWFYTITYM